MRRKGKVKKRYKTLDIYIETRKNIEEALKIDKKKHEHEVYKKTGVESCVNMYKIRKKMKGKRICLSLSTPPKKKEIREKKRKF